MVRSTVFLLCLVTGLWANEAVDRARKLEDAGGSAGAREAFAQALRNAPGDAETLDGYAQFLERYKDPGAREAWRKSAAAWKKTGRTSEAAAATRQLVLLDLTVGDRTAAEADLATYHELGGKDLQMPGPAAVPPSQFETIPIPGPLRSFARMAAITTDVHPEELLPALATNIVTSGYQAVHGNEELEETEYLKLVQRYLAQARELDKLAGADKVIRVPTCDSTQTNDLLRVLGYRIRGACGSEVVLETINASRAFVTTDSGFPLSELELALRTDKPFTYDFHPALAPVLYGPAYWLTAKEKAQGDFIDAFLGDPGLCRFYLGMSKLDPETAGDLRRGVPAVRLRAYANVLDFFGGNFEIRQGKAVVPGGARTSAAWSDLDGASADKGTEFFEKLLSKDDGWLASLFDALARLSPTGSQGAVLDYFTEPARLKRLYSAVRGRVTTPGPARPVFRSNADMMLLTTRLRIDPDGRVHLPGGLDVWKDLFSRSPKNKYDPKLAKAALGWKDADDVIEAMFGLLRKPVDNEALAIFMALTDIDRNRPQPLRPETVQRLVRGWNTFGAQYSIFNDVPALSDKTITLWMDVAESIDKLRDPLFRDDVAGTMQGLTGLWQIFCRQGSVPPDKADAALASLIGPFGTIKTSRELFDTGRAGINALLKTADAGGGPAQDRILGLLAGGPKLDDSDARMALVQEEQRIFEAQKLLSVDLLFDLADNLEAVTKGAKLNAQLASRLAARVADIQLPRNTMTGMEKNSSAFGFYVDRHIDEERKLNFRAMIDRGAKDPEKLKDIRGQLAPALRDTIIGFNYVHYAPPGAQILMTNPLFVRGHDFFGMTGANHSWKATEIYGTGWPANAGGRLVGSLSGLPYALAEAEQNFLVPTHTQALIWGDLVPQMMLSARTLRFWTVTPAQMHWIGVHMRYAESLIAEAALDPARRNDLAAAINRVASPLRTWQVDRDVAAGDARGAIESMTPSELYWIAENMLGSVAQDKAAPGGTSPGSAPLAAEVAHLKAAFPDQVSPAAISRAWGTPKPTLANSYRPELLNLRTFPTLMGYSSRVMAESWESNQLYWADVGDQLGVQPAQLNVLVPQWTQKVVERIFASNLEDWPALLRSLRSVGEEVRTQNAQVAEKQ
jgi:hypothetical protein